MVLEENNLILRDISRNQMCQLVVVSSITLVIPSQSMRTLALTRVDSGVSYILDTEVTSS